MARLRIRRTGPGRPRTRPDRLLAAKAYSSRGSRGGRPVTFDNHAYRLRNTVERAVGKLRGHRAVATPSARKHPRALQQLRRETRDQPRKTSGRESAGAAGKDGCQAVGPWHRPRSQWPRKGSHI